MTKKTNQPKSGDLPLSAIATLYSATWPSEHHDTWYDVAVLAGIHGPRPDALERALRADPRFEVIPFGEMSVGTRGTPRPGKDGYYPFARLRGPAEVEAASAAADAELRAADYVAEWLTSWSGVPVTCTFDGGQLVVTGLTVDVILHTDEKVRKRG